MILKTVADATAQCLNLGTCNTGLPTVQANNESVQTILQFTFGLLGALAVIVIIIGAVQLTSSGGNPEAATTARRTVTYALIGLAIAISAEVIVTFVLGTIG